MKKTLIITIVFLPLVLYARQQSQPSIDSLLNRARQDTNKVKLLNELSNAYNAQKEQINTLESQQSIVNYVLIFIAALVLLLLYFIYRYYRLQKKARAIILAEQQNTEQQRLRAERSEQFEQRFLANVSHEIRTPMNTVLGMTNLTLDTQLTPKQNRYLTAVKKSSENLLVIINDLLERNKLESRRSEPDNIQFNLAEQIDEVIEPMQSKAREKGLTMHAEIASEIPHMLTGDPSRLKQVLTNLCRNAIRFTDKGNVTIVVEKLEGTDATLRFRVIDSGMGVSTDKVSDLFEAFLQEEADAAGRDGDAGVGLSIAKTLVELEGGEIEVKSEKGKGSEFFFTITYGVGDDHAVDSLQGMKILVAEDDEYNQMVITDTLETLIEGVKVDLAENGNIAIEKHLANDYDVILMDVQMPGLDGLQATSQIRKTLTGKKRDIPIIALTAGVLNTDLDKCYEAGMNDYIPKPFTRAHLLNTLAKFHTNKAAQPGETKNDQSTITDLTYLRGFCDGDETKMRKYIEIYLKVTPGNIEKIVNAAEKKDYVILAKTVHAIKAQLNYMGMKQTRKLAELIELHIKEQKNLDELPQLIYKLQEDSKGSIKELSLF